jgi:hypothetical protein
MLLRCEGQAVHLDGACTAEDALPLVEFLLNTASARVVMEDCESLHTAVLQVILAAKPQLTMPPNSLLANCLRHLDG